VANPQVVTVESLPQEWRELLDAATRAREKAYAPYSRFPVGAAVRAASGRVFAGSNIENAAFGLTVCAERVAIWKAISEGERRLAALAVVTDTGTMPCGSCLQVMTEFATEDMPILIADPQGRAWLTTLREILPYPFPHTSIQK
jgi:cytidine deaminase